MTIEQVRQTIRSQADEKRRLSNQKRGISDSIGTPLGKVRPLAKKLGHRPDMARQLWSGGVYEERLLAMMIIKPDDLSPDEIENWVTEADPLLSDELAFRVLKTRELDLDHWKGRSDKLECFAWMHQAATIKQTGPTSDEDLETIRRDMKQAPKLIQEGMNRLLVETGLAYDELLPKVLEIAEEIGPWDDRVVHPGCVGTYAPEWIESVKKRSVK